MKNFEIDIKTKGSLEYAKANVMLIDYSSSIKENIRPMVIVCPGGGYEHTSDREADFIAFQFLAAGYHATVLRYSVKPATYPTAMLELGRTILQIRRNAKEWNVDPNKIVIVGFSAGGHLCGSFAENWQEDFVKDALECGVEELKPNAMILGYPVVTSGADAHRGSFENLFGERYSASDETLSLEKHVKPCVPKAFIWNTYKDGSVPCINSVLMVEALVRAGIPVEYHMFEEGPHGIALANEVTVSNKGIENVKTAQRWVKMCMDWMKGI